MATGDDFGWERRRSHRPTPSHSQHDAFRSFVHSALMTSTAEIRRHTATSRVAAVHVRFELDRRALARPDSHSRYALRSFSHSLVRWFARSPGADLTTSCLVRAAETVCSSDNDCLDPEDPRCDVSKSPPACVECLDSGDCDYPAEFCRQSDNVCVACLDNSHCGYVLTFRRSLAGGRRPRRAVLGVARWGPLSVRPEFPTQSPTRARSPVRQGPKSVLFRRQSLRLLPGRQSVFVAVALLSD